jgi:hypothetical protein
MSVKASAIMLGLLVVALSASCTSGSETAASTTSSAHTIAANEATISGTLTSATGPTQTSPEVLTGCVQVTPVTALGPAACSVSVGPDGTWSLVVKPGAYDVFGLSLRLTTPGPHAPPRSTTRSGCVRAITCSSGSSAFHEVTGPTGAATGCAAPGRDRRHVSSLSEVGFLRFPMSHVSGSGRRRV